MRKIQISDVTMKSAAPGGHALSFREKIELAKLLDRLGVDVVETGAAGITRTDCLLIKSVAGAVRGSAVAVPVPVTAPESAEAAWGALCEALHPRLQAVAPVSTVQMEYFCHIKPDAMLTAIGQTVARCRALCPEVEFVAEDAVRADRDFLRRAVAAAAEAGAAVVTVCDAAGTLLPDEFGAFVAELRALLPAGTALGVSCSNDLFMADACAAAAIRAGADEVKTVACGEATASLSRLARILAARGDAFGGSCGVRTTELERTVGQIRWMCETDRSKTSPFDSGVRDGGDGLVLTVHDDPAAVLRAASALGYELSEEDGERVWEAFRRIAAKKERVGAKELDAIVASAALQVPPTYRLESYVINSGNVITASAHIRLKKGEETLEGICVGDGPIDAAFLAVEQIAGRHYELDDFQIQAVTEGREAMGETVVRLRSGGKVYAGRGISTDIIGASIRAYVSALNKIAYEEHEV